MNKDIPNEEAQAPQPSTAETPPAFVPVALVEADSVQAATPPGEVIRNLKKELKICKEQVIEQDIRIFEMTALLQSGKGLSNIRNLPELLDTLMAVVRERYNSVNACVLLFDDVDQNKGEYFRVQRFHGLDEYFIDEKDRSESLYLFKFPKNNGLLWQIVQQGDVFSVRDMLKEPRFEPAWERWNLDILRSDIWCPLIKGGDVLGILMLGERENGTQIPESEYDFLQELAAIATTIIDSTLKYEKNQRILKNIQTLFDVNQQLARVSEFKTLCEEILRSAVESLRAQKGNLMLLNRASGKLELQVVSGHIPELVIMEINEGKRPTKDFMIGEGVAGRAAELRKPVVVNDRDEITQIGDNKTYCICSIPVINGNELEGVINITNKMGVDEKGHPTVDPLGRFNADDISLLQGISDQAATSLFKARLYNASITDRLTGLFNNRHFEDEFNQSLIRSCEQNRVVSLAITDIDHFKKFNDTYGHKAGDFVLQQVARVFQQSCRVGPSSSPSSGDKAFRYGGEEFCMILPDTNETEALKLLNEFRLTLQNETFDFNGQDLKVTVSIGIACYPNDGVTTKELFTRADECLYACKKGGRNRVLTTRSLTAPAAENVAPVPPIKAPSKKKSD